jgi:predicted nucleotidyltransferase
MSWSNATAIRLRTGTNDTARASDLMRLTSEQIATIRAIVAEFAGSDASVRLFGSRLDDAARGGDVDLLVELPQPAADPAPLAARIAGRISRAMDGRKVDVVLLAPNLMRLPIHDEALRTGVKL